MPHSDSLVQAVLRVVFPPRCAACGQLSKTDFCADCVPIPIPDALDLTRRLHFTPRFTDAWAAYVYSGAGKRAVWQLKFNKMRGNARVLGTQMAEAAAAHWRGEDFDAVCAAPMRLPKQKERGYNQAELLARVVARERGVPYRRWLIKTRDTAIQHELPLAERTENVRGAYKAVAARGKVLLVDDVFTTGNTVNACAEVLLQAGASEVYVLCAAVVCHDESQSESRRGDNP